MAQTVRVRKNNKLLKNLWFLVYFGLQIFPLMFEMNVHTMSDVGCNPD